MAYYRTAMSGGGSGIVNTVKLLTSSQALTSTGVTYTFPSNYKFARVRITRLKRKESVIPSRSGRRQPIFILINAVSSGALSDCPSLGIKPTTSGETDWKNCRSMPRTYRMIRS